MLSRFVAPGILASFCLLGMALGSVLHLLFPALPLWASGLSGWAALAFLLLGSQSLRPFTQFFLLAGTGVLLLVWGMMRGASVSPPDILLQNNGLLVMLYCVGFLRLIAAGEDAAKESLPHGKQAFLQTLLGVHILGAVINISILILMAERLRASGALDKLAVVVLSRGFSMAAFWSPFFAAMAVALTYAPGAQLYPVVLTGLGLMGVSLLLSVLELGGLHLQKVADFRGYPLHFASVIIPVLLAVSVMVLHELLPSVPILMIVSTTAVVLTVVFLWAKRPQTVGQKLAAHVLASGSRMAREVSLFLGAGLLSAGVQALSGTFDWQPFSHFGGMQASLALAVAILVSLSGVHPVVSVGVLGSLLTSIQVDPNLLAVLFLCFWSLGVVASPFSGLNTILRSQFEASGMELFKGNIRYVVLMWLVASLLFFLWNGKGVSV
ncbi:hypothetical protein VSS37_08005 [Candidatus Thiothrix sp. Deng01]|uniref:Uncharacterized protein n=1 Tax=Candidatus Thiothrix phosphatis TaxID=3112415 RepID=A0ABU6CWG3_9GAMM|nr:hypothetical protein [Candidatus Thiothrix sp. Deng01]MEB4590916.1 hypothetical protein [Candidatus Thiothrix sp. Deng01]